MQAHSFSLVICKLFKFLICYLFAFYLNDLPDLLKQNPEGGVQVGNTRVFLLMFADDIVMVSNSPVGLQNSLDLFYDYCHKWKLVVNMQKSKVLICKRLGHNLVSEVWFYGDQLLDICDEYTYLGITFTTGGITNRSINILTSQAKKVLASMYNHVQRLGTFPPTVALRCFHTCISPILNYSAGVWGYMAAQCMQTLLNRFCKNTLGVKLSSSNYAMAAELGQYPIYIQRKMSLIKYWFKIITGSHERYRYKMYVYLKSEIDRTYPRNWAAEVKHILVQVGRIDVWYTESVNIDIDGFIRQVQSTLIDLYIQEWVTGIYGQDKMITYRSFKHIFCHESYLCNVKIPKFRIALCQLRVSSHSLNIELGRYAPRVPRERRYCVYCNDTIDNEYHFVLICNHHNTLRQRYVPTYYYARPSIHKFIELMSVEDPSVQVSLAKYVYYAFKQRQ